MPARRESLYTGRMTFTGRMTLTIDLPLDALARLEAEARRRGVGLGVVVAELAVMLPDESSDPPKPFSLVGVGSASPGHFARDADALLADGFGQD
jgi:hypothetical protein